MTREYNKIQSLWIHISLCSHCLKIISRLTTGFLASFTKETSKFEGTVNLNLPYWIAMILHIQFSSMQN